MLYGRTSDIARLDRRRKGPGGNIQHAAAVAIQKIEKPEKFRQYIQLPDGCAFQRLFDAVITILGIHPVPGVIALILIEKLHF